MRTLEDIERDLKKAYEDAKPIFEARERAMEKINSFHKELNQFKLDNGLFNPMSDLVQHKGKYIRDIELVEKRADGTLGIKYMYGDELFKIDENGHLDYSSYNNGIMYYKESEKAYMYEFYGRGTKYDFVGYLSIEFGDEDE